MTDAPAADLTALGSEAIGMEQVVHALVETPPTGEQPPRRRGGRRTKAMSHSPARRHDGQTEVQPWGSVPPEFDPILRAAEQEPAVLGAALMLREALLKEPKFLPRAMASGVVSVIHAPDVAWGKCVARAWDLIVEAVEESMAGGRESPPAPPPSDRAFNEALRARSDVRRVRGPDNFRIFQKPPKMSEHIELFKDAIASGKAIHVVCQDPDGLLPPEILVSEQQRLVIPPLSAEIIQFLGERLGGDREKPVPPSSATPSNLNLIAAASSPFLINAAASAGQRDEGFIHCLASLVERQTTLTPRQVIRTLTLDDLPGLGSVGLWGRQVAGDLAAYARGQIAWADMERGVVLEGPPGTGKSSFAKAMAGTAGVPLVAASLAQWQGHRDGHLGNLLSAMQASFALARQSVPCVLLIDEIDSFPSRASVTHQHKDYVVEVVNALLEQLDDAIDRAGVFVLGTCNDARGLDPALVRAGRLERIIQVGRPDAAGIEEILRGYLGDALSAVDLKPLASTAVMRRACGADIEAWSRAARRRARVAGRRLVLDDLIEEIGQPPSRHPPDAVRRMAVHEAGHAIGFALTAPGILQQVIVDPTVGSTSATRVDVTSLYHDLPHATREGVMVQLRAVLAGRAAEEFILGSPSGGAGGSDRSDLARATTIACMLVTSSGLDSHPDGLVYMASAQDIRRHEQFLLHPEIRSRISEILRQGYDDALALIRLHHATVLHIADIVVRDGMMPGKDVEALLHKANDHEQRGDLS